MIEKKQASQLDDDFPGGANRQPGEGAGGRGPMTETKGTGGGEFRRPAKPQKKKNAGAAGTK